MEAFHLSLLVTTLLVIYALVDQCNGYHKGFPPSACNNMLPEGDPDYTDEEGTTAATGGGSPASPKPTVGGRATTAMTDTDDLRRPPLILSNRKSPYSLVISNDTVARNGKIYVSVAGDDVEAFMIQAMAATVPGDEERNISARVGVFTDWDRLTTRPMRCGEPRKIRALTNTDLTPKVNLTFQWKAPFSDEPEVVMFRATFTLGNEYWTEVDSKTITIAKFPVTLANCGISKSCFRATETLPDCDTKSCDYIITYKLSPDNKTINIEMGGESKDGNYIAVGFADGEEDSHKDITLYACMKDAGAIEINNFYLSEFEAQPVDQTRMLEDVYSDTIEGVMWCGFKRPLAAASENMIDLNKPVYHIYMWGKINRTESSLPVPIIPSIKDVVITDKPVDLGEFKNTTKSFTSAASPPANSFLLLMTSLLVVRIFGRRL